MNKNVVAKLDRSMRTNSVEMEELTKAVEGVALEEQKSSKFEPFEKTFDLGVHSYSMQDLDLDLLDETINYRHMTLLLSIKAFDRYPNIIRLYSTRLFSLMKELKKYGMVEVINDISQSEEIADAVNLVVRHPSGISSQNIYLLLSEQATLDAAKYPEYKDDVLNDNVLYSEVVQVFVHPGNTEAYELCSRIEESCSVEILDTEVYIEMIVQTSQGLATQRVLFDAEYGNDLDLHYGDGFSQFHEKLVERIQSRDKGIVMFHGPPGNGKTHYIRRLLPDLNKGGKRVILIPKHILESLESPNFNMFMIQNFVGQKIIFVMEDAESIITKRNANDGGRSQLVSTLLNITDGILNDIFSIQVILTFNTELTSIDEALLRKGRLIAKYEFKSLKRDNAERLADHLGLSIDTLENKKEYSLAEIYALREAEEDDLLINQNLEVRKEPVGF